jgi:hypothetical protein
MKNILYYNNQIRSNKNNIKSIYKKYSNTKKYYILEFLINLYLMECKYRNIFQIYLHNFNKISKEIKIILDNVSYNYLIVQEKNNIRIIVYNKELFNINDLDITFGKKYAKQLGEFYTCATDNFKNNHYRIVIHIQGNNTYAELYAQMCKKTMIIKNINKIIKILNEIEVLLLKFDKILKVKIQIYNN